MSKEEITLRKIIIDKMDSNVGFFSVGVCSDYLLEQLKITTSIKKLPDEKVFAELVREDYPKYVKDRINEWPELYDGYPDFGEIGVIVGEIVIKIGDYSSEQMMELIQGRRIDES